MMRVVCRQGAGYVQPKRLHIPPGPDRSKTILSDEHVSRRRR